MDQVIGNASTRFSLIEIGGLEPLLDGQVGDYLTTWWDVAHEHYEPPASTASTCKARAG